MRKTILVEMPDKPDVAKFVLIDRPGITYVNTACKCRKGIVRIVPATPQEQKGKPIHNR